MRQIENECVGCPPEIGCIGPSCPYVHVTRCYCDVCGESAEYTIDGKDYCENCATEYLQEAFDAHSIIEKAELLDMEIGF